VSTLVVVTGASSGIGAAIAQTVPYDDARILAVSRRPGPAGEHVAADLSDPGSWPLVADRIRTAVAAPGVTSAALMHFAGVATPHGPAARAAWEEYTAAVLLNAASGPAIGQAFLAACADRGIHATVVMCSSPAAAFPMPGMSHYGAGKQALEHWTRAIAAEHAPTGACVFAVVPFAVDTPMVRAAMQQPPDVHPVAANLRAAADRGALAAADATAREIWRLVLDGDHEGEIIPVGAVPPGVGPR